MGDAGTDGRRERRARELAERVVDAAEAELAEQGLEAFSVERVAERADVALQTVYNRVGRRDALLLAAAQRALERDHEYMSSAYGLSAPGEATIEAAAAAYVRFAFEHPTPFRLLAQPPGRPWEPEHSDGVSAAVSERIAAAVEEQNAHLQQALERAVAEGAARRVDPERAATALWAMLNGLLSLAWRADRLRASPDEMRALVDVALDLLRNGLASRPDAARPGDDSATRT